MAEAAGHTLIVGASSGIGRAVAERFAARGAVTALARRTDRLAELSASGIATVAADVTDLAAISGVVQGMVAERGLLTGLVYCAGVQVIKPMRSLTVEEVERLYTTNLVAPTLFATAFSSARISTRDAVFCAVSSVAAQRPEPAILPYAASKAGLDALIRGLARELAPRRAVAVAPGWLDTEMTQAHARLYGESFKEALEKRSPSGAATVASVVDAIAFLMSPQARHVTGEILRIDGGAAL
ncbi:SDR family NAD(P)-dependent oxidoreductase [Methylobacterium radiotolerans]|uniref:SDR family NAD(P)-dependent oxidoreductase n=1 Tax=Methylobacterium radiotolerans TaxID=31998 RepID=UPI000978AC72|nr:MULTISPECIES: SDR family oxidoreductase [Methylobacterium]MDE3749503.1 SDR family NAD(P)-dependent oxidoreductase [Methylobacterium radiotolerans]ONF48368.1 short-chain dehydrogenase [Methylobacterium radiotolerans]PVY94255.1 NAD(P)-dependent dehydrogenase (short-subunit alcohol dehydrogenase family) [Methylobacterium organophilum]